MHGDDQSKLSKYVDERIVAIARILAKGLSREHASKFLRLYALAAERIAISNGDEKA
jgi:hypothetical protein